jgi:hypothetical protein
MSFLIKREVGRWTGAVDAVVADTRFQAAVCKD